MSTWQCSPRAGSVSGPAGDISFTPGFSPVSNDDKKRGTVLTVSSCAHTVKPFLPEGYINSNSETVETVS